MALCKCGCGLPARPRGLYHSWPHFVRGGGPAANGQRGGWTKSKAREKAALWRLAERFGDVPSKRDALMFKAGRVTGYNLGLRAQRRVREAR